MILYYGADCIVEHPEYNSPKSNPSNDYGVGFYLTDDKEMAKLWAGRYETGYLITYDINMKGLKKLFLDDAGEESVLKWISVLVNHRFSKSERDRYAPVISWLNENYSFDVEDIDLIIGYRADDAYFDYSRDFVSNDLSLEALSSAMKLGELGKQYVLISQKAFKSIKMIRYEKVQRSDEYSIIRKINKERYLTLKKGDNINNTFIRDIMRKK